MSEDGTLVTREIPQEFIDNACTCYNPSIEPIKFKINDETIEIMGCVKCKKIITKLNDK